MSEIPSLAERLVGVGLYGVACVAFVLMLWGISRQ